MTGASPADVARSTDEFQMISRMAERVCIARRDDAKETSGYARPVQVAEERDQQLLLAENSAVICSHAADDFSLFVGSFIISDDGVRSEYRNR